MHIKKKIILENSRFGMYARNYGKTKRDLLRTGDKDRLCKKENTTENRKANKGRFINKAGLLAFVAVIHIL